MFLKSSDMRHIPFNNKTRITERYLALNQRHDAIHVVGYSIYIYISRIFLREIADPGSRIGLRNWHRTRMERPYWPLVISHCLGDVSWGVTNASSKARPKDIPGYLAYYLAFLAYVHVECVCVRVQQQRRSCDTAYPRRTQIRL